MLWAEAGAEPLTLLEGAAAVRRARRYLRARGEF